MRTLDPTGDKKKKGKAWLYIQKESCRGRSVLSGFLSPFSLSGRGGVIWKLSFTNSIKMVKSTEHHNKYRYLGMRGTLAGEQSHCVLSLIEGHTPSVERVSAVSGSLVGAPQSLDPVKKESAWKAWHCLDRLEKPFLTFEYERWSWCMHESLFIFFFSALYLFPRWSKYELVPVTHGRVVFLVLQTSYTVIHYLPKGTDLDHGTLPRNLSVYPNNNTP